MVAPIHARAAALFAPNFTLPAPTQARKWEKDASPAVVEAPLPEQYLYVIGDLHGDYENAVTLLENAGVIEKMAKGADPASVQWKAGKATLVCTGDTINKGPDSL